MALTYSSPCAASQVESQLLLGDKRTVFAGRELALIRLARYSNQSRNKHHK